MHKNCKILVLLWLDVPLSKNVLRKMTEIPVICWLLGLFCVIFKLYTKEYKQNIANLSGTESDSMLDNKICKLRDELNKCISDGDDYSKIYKVSVELDKLIAEYYKTNN